MWCREVNALAQFAFETHGEANYDTWRQFLGLICLRGCHEGKLWCWEAMPWPNLPPRLSRRQILIPGGNALARFASEALPRRPRRQIGPRHCLPAPHFASETACSFPPCSFPPCMPSSTHVTRTRWWCVRGCWQRLRVISCSSCLY